MRGYDSDVRIRVIAVYRMLLRGKPITLNEIMQELKEKYGMTAADIVKAVEGIL